MEKACSAPVEKGQKVGEVWYILDKNIIGKVVFMKENFSMLRAESAPDSITLYWERPQGRLGTTYEIFLKSADQVEADFTLIWQHAKDALHDRKLQANTEYEILVKGIYQVDIALIEDGSKSVQIEKEIKQQTITMYTFNRSVELISQRHHTMQLEMEKH